MRPYGRRAFLAVAAGGLTSLWWGKPVWDRLSTALHPLAGALPSQVRDIVPSGWRIYTVAASMPVFDSATWRLRIGGLVEQPQELSYDQLRALPQASQVPAVDPRFIPACQLVNGVYAGVAAFQPPHPG